jgi:hypothetical protein
MWNTPSKCLRRLRLIDHAAPLLAGYQRPILANDLIDFLSLDQRPREMRWRLDDGRAWAAVLAL